MVGKAVGGASAIRSTVTRYNKVPIWRTAMRAEKSKHFHGPSFTHVSLELSSRVGLKTKSDGSRKKQSPAFGRSCVLQSGLSNSDFWWSCALSRDMRALEIAFCNLSAKSIRSVPAVGGAL